MYFVYLVECSDGTYYTGYTNDVKKRVKTHNKGQGAKYTKTRRPVRLIGSRAYPTRSKAMQMEHRVKTMSRREKREFITYKQGLK